MQPENNVQNNATEGQKSEAAVKKVVEMETKPVVTEPPKDDIVFNNKSKKSTGMVLGMVFLAILAIGGIGFGVWATMDGNARVDALNEQIKASKVQDNELLDKIKDFEEYEDDADESVEIEAITDADVDSDTNVSKDIDTNMSINAADYIYAGDWGLKIKIIDNLKEVGYASFNGNRFCVAGLTSRANYPYKFGNLYENFPGLACVTRGPSDYKSKDCDSLFSIGDYNYCVFSSSLSKYSRTEE